MWGQRLLRRRSPRSLNWRSRLIWISFPLRRFEDTMNKTLTAAVLAAGLGLGSCASTGTTPTSITTTLNSVVSDIVGFAEAACSFQPDVSSVEAIINTLYPGAAVATVPEQAV